MRAAVAAIAGRIARHVRRRTGPDTWIVELCPGYLATAGHAYATAWRAWQWLRPRLGWAEVPWHTVRGVLRERPAGGRWGRHLVVTDDVLAAAASAAAALGDDGPATGPASRVAVERRDPAGRGWARCPWHDDRAPSLVINPSGVAHCFGCGTNGRWIAAGVDHVDVRRTVNTSGRATTPRRQGEAPRPPQDAPGPREATPEAPRPGGEAIELRAGRRASVWGLRTADAWSAVLAADRAADAPPGWEVPDRWIRLDPSRPTAWTVTRRGRWAPARWQTTAARWVVVDLDARDPTQPRCPEGTVAWADVDRAAHASAGAPWAEAMGAALRARLAGDPRWSGRALVLRTSLGALHVAVELAEAAVPTAWRGELGRAARALGAWLEGCAAAAGFDVAADPQSWRAGRAVRRPGPREATRDGLGWVVRVVATTDR